MEIDYGALAEWLVGEAQCLTPSDPDASAVSSHSDIETKAVGKRLPRALRKPRKRTFCFNENSAEEIRKTGGVYAKRRSDGRILTHLVFPKIPKNDIRRTYPQMLVNTHNSGAVQFMANFLGTFGTGSFRFRHQIRDLLSDRMWQLTVGDKDDMAYFWSRLFDLIPDGACRLDAAQVIARSDGTAVIQCDVGFTGTLMLTNYKLSSSVARPEVIEAMEKEERVSVSHGGAHESLLVCSLLMQAEGAYCNLSGAMTRAVHVHAKQRVRLHLNPNNKIHFLVNELLEDKPAGTTTCLGGDCAATGAALRPEVGHGM